MLQFVTYNSRGVDVMSVKFHTRVLKLGIAIDATKYIISKFKAKEETKSRNMIRIL